MNFHYSLILGKWEEGLRYMWSKSDRVTLFVSTFMKNKLTRHPVTRIWPTMNNTDKKTLTKLSHPIDIYPAGALSKSANLGPPSMIISTNRSSGNYSVLF